MRRAGFRLHSVTVTATLVVALLSPSMTLAGSTAAAAPTPMDHVRALAALGPRTPGSAADRAAQRYITAQLRSWGYQVRTQHVPVPGLPDTNNLIAIRPGTSQRRVLVGAHMDSKSPSPGANDNASGVAVTLELARRLSSTTITPTVVFAFFGAEEIAGRHPWEHHFGSTEYAKRMTFYETRYLAGVVSVDMVGYGSQFHTRTMGIGPRRLESSLRSRASALGYDMTYLRDFGRYGWSDHEPFERLGFPVAWIEWRDDPLYHTRRDVASHVEPSRLAITTRVLDSWLRNSTSTQLESIAGW